MSNSSTVQGVVQTIGAAALCFIVGFLWSISGDMGVLKAQQQAVVQAFEANRAARDREIDALGRKIDTEVSNIKEKVDELGDELEDLNRRLRRPGP